ncbi:MAG: DUF1272 domain-containing protein [Acidiferrobacterales bacterium]
MVLEMRQRCEKCEVALAPDGEAYICTYECTFCRGCTETMQYTCSNCNGELLQRPRRVTRGEAR